MVTMPRDVANEVCDLSAWYPAGWRGWCMNYWHYEIRFFARGPEIVRRMGPQDPDGLFVIYPKYDRVRSMILVPRGRARIDVEFVAVKGR